MPQMNDHAFLRVMRLCLVGFAAMVLFYALNSELSIFGMVESAYKITLASACGPWLFGAFWKRATSQGRALSLYSGLAAGC